MMGTALSMPCSGIREWLAFLFTCENQLMLGLLKENHFQAARLAVGLVLLGQGLYFMIIKCWVILRKLGLLAQ